MNIDVKEMDNNAIFSQLLFLTGFTYDTDLLVRLLEERGFKATKAKITSWRRKSGKANARPVPNEVLVLLFQILFDEKNKNPNFCQYPEIKNQM